MSRHVVNWLRLSLSVEESRKRLGLSDRQLGKQLGIDYCALSRLRHGAHLSADNLATLVAWLYPTQVPDWIDEIPCPTCGDQLAADWQCTDCGNTG